MTTAYRGVDQIAEARYAALGASLGGAGQDALRRVYAKREGRIVGGAVGMAVAVLAFVVAFVPWKENLDYFGRPGSGASTYVLLSAWPIAALAMLFTRAISSARVTIRRFVRSGDSLQDLAAMERFDPARVLAERATQRERLSVALPLGAIALLAPLTLHFLVSLALSNGAARSSPNDFDMWIRWSVILVGHCHIVLAACAFRFARQLAARDTAEVALGTARDGMRAVGWTALTSLVPGAVLVLVPPALVVATGLAFVPLSFALMGRIVLAERRAITAALTPEPALA